MYGIRFFKPNLKVLMMMGLWKSENLKNPTLNFLYTNYTIFMFSYFVIFNITEIIEIFNIGFDILPLMANLIATLLYVCTVLKAYTVLFRKRRIRQILNVVKRVEDNLIYMDSEEKRLYEESVMHNKYMAKFFLYLTSTTVVGFWIARPAEYFILGPQEINHYKVPILFR